MSVLKVKNGNQWDIVPAIKGDTGDPAADESITDDMLVTDGIKTEIEWLWGNQLMDSREGELLHAEDAYTAPAVDISVDGKSTQVTTTGKNLFDKNTAYAGWYINSSGIRANGSSNSCTDFIPVTGGNSYAFSYGAALAAGNYIAWYTDADESTVTGNRVDARGLQNIVATAPIDAKYVRFSFQTSTLKNIQLEIGSSATAYEPYTGGMASPSPDWPQEIVSVENPELAFHGENMWGGSKMAEDFNALKAVVYGSNEHGDYIEFEQGGGLPNNGRFYPCPFKDDTQYTIVLAFENTRGNRYTTIIVGYSDGTYKEITGPNTDGSYAQFVFVTAANKTVDYLCGVLRTVNNRYYYNQCGIFEGVHTVDDFQPYSSATASLLPDGYSLRSLPDGTKDELHLSYLRPSTREGWAWYSRELVKRVAPIVLNGILPSGNSYTDYSFNVSRSSGSPDYAYAYSGAWDSIIKGVGACDKLVRLSVSSGGSGSVVDTDSIGNGSSDYRIRMLLLNIRLGIDWDADNMVARARKFNAWIVNNPITALCELATPTTETLDPIELPIMPSQTVNVWSDPATNLKMTYIQDSNLIIENLEATIADIATS